MTITITSPITGGAQTGFTTPTYTVTTDTAPDVNGKQVAVTALGGTQAGVTVHSAANPFTATFFRPKTFRALTAPNPVNGRLASVPRNVYGIIVRKGVTPLAGQPVTNLVIRTTIEVPAGADVADGPNIRAAISMLVGLLNQQSAGMGDTYVTSLF